MKWVQSLVITILITGQILSAQDFGTSFLSREKSVNGLLQQIDSQFPRSLTWSSYQIEDTIIYNSPNLLRLFKNEIYHFLITFSFDSKKKKITHQNFQKNKYAIKVDVADTSAFVVKTVSASPQGVSIRGVAQGEIDTHTFIKFSVVTVKGQEVGGALFGLVSPGNKNYLGFTQYLQDINPTYFIPRDSNALYSPEFERIDRSFFIGKK